MGAHETVIGNESTAKEIAYYESWSRPYRIGNSNPGRFYCSFVFHQGAGGLIRLLSADVVEMAKSFRKGDWPEDRASLQSQAGQGNCGEVGRAGLICWVLKCSGVQGRRCLTYQLKTAVK